MLALAVFAAPTRADSPQSPSRTAAPTLAEIKASGASTSILRQQTSQTEPEGPPKPDLETFRDVIAPILRDVCTGCHGGQTQEGDFRIDTLDPDLLHGGDVSWWIEVVDVLSNGEMPPPGEDELSDRDRSRLIEWLSSQLQVASTVRRSQQGHSSFRRMTRYEYNYALQDLLGLPYDFAEDLPPETASADGFQNSSDVLQMSAMQFGYYRDLGRAALNRAVVHGEQPDQIHWSITMDAAVRRAERKYEADVQEKQKELKDDPKRLQAVLDRFAADRIVRRGATHFTNLNSDHGYRAHWRYSGARYAWTPSASQPPTPSVSANVALIPAGQRLYVELGNQLPETGTLRIRTRAARTSTDGANLPSLCWEFGWQASNNSAASERIAGPEVVVEAAPQDPQIYQWEIPLSELSLRNPLRKTGVMGKTPSPSEFLRLHNNAISKADVQVDWIEITAPVYEQWPPESHVNIFPDKPQNTTESEYARTVLAKFMPRAWRRDIDDQEIEQKLALFTRFRPQYDNMQDAMVEVLATVLASPKFLYLIDTHGDDISNNPERQFLASEFELATRLAMFLWCSTPDAELMKLASDGRLSAPSVLAEQTQRMLADQRSQRFANHFVRQWLGMQLLDFLSVDKKVYRDFDTSLKTAMQREPIEMFREVLQQNHSVMDFIHADYVVVNERLARHYGIQNVSGNQFRRVNLTSDSTRGGLLTQSGLLAMNSDGKDSHPLKRSIWLLESLLNDPPPPPPPAVPEIDLTDPKILQMTLKERMADHRNQPACHSCHAKIDPWGIALENFDAIGSWRTEIDQEPVDATSVLFNQQELSGVDGLKRYLLSQRQDQFATAMVYKMTTFALGRPLTFRDRAELNEIAVALRRRGDGLNDLVNLIVSSDLFRNN